MRTTSEVLRRARELLAGGWHEPLSLDAQGHICTADDEGLSRLCLADALQVASAGDVGAYMRAEDAIERQLASMGWTEPVYRWLELPERTQAEVLRLLQRAHAHTTAKEAA